MANELSADYGAASAAAARLRQVGEQGHQIEADRRRIEADTASLWARQEDPVPQIRGWYDQQASNLGQVLDACAQNQQAIADLTDEAMTTFADVDAERAARTNRIG